MHESTTVNKKTYSENRVDEELVHGIQYNETFHLKFVHPDHHGNLITKSTHYSPSNYQRRRIRDRSPCSEKQNQENGFNKIISFICYKKPPLMEIPGQFNKYSSAHKLSKPPKNRYIKACTSDIKDYPIYPIY